MPHVQYVGSTPAAPPGWPMWAPDEVREVSAAQAEYLCANASYRRLDEDAAPEDPARDETPAAAPVLGAAALVPVETMAPNAPQSAHAAPEQE